jgi:YVTN family beta-propeller protein
MFSKETWSFPDGKRLPVASDSGLYVIDTSTNKVTVTLPVIGNYNNIAFIQKLGSPLFCG